MTEYKIEITLPAERDLFDIFTYITETLKEPQIEERIYTSIKREILTLSTMPERHRIVEEQPYAAMGVRKLLVENYIVFYIVDKKSEIVSILRVLYNRREWQRILGEDN